MNGKIIVSILVIAAVVMGFGLWYSIERAYYYQVSGVTEVQAYGKTMPVSDYKGIDAATSPLKMRACFKVNWDYIPSDSYKGEATPLIAPSNFKCFDAGQLTRDLESGKATAILSKGNKPYGFDTYIMQYPDGRAFMWRQINKCGKAKFSDKVLPKGCPAPALQDQSLNTVPLRGGKTREMTYYG